MPSAKLVLDYVYEHEAAHPNKILLTQPLGNGKGRRLLLEAGVGRSAADGCAPAGRGPGAGHPHRNPVQGACTEAALRSMAWGGRLLVIGFTSGDIPHPPLNVPLLKGCSIVGV